MAAPRLVIELSIETAELAQLSSIATNGQPVAEQIGAQIFIDAWATSKMPGS